MAHDFNVRLSGIELSSSEEQQLNKAMQSAVLGHLAQIDRRRDIAAVLRDFVQARHGY
jgi:hypothetical protein